MKERAIKVIIADDHQMVRETWKMLLQKDERIIVVAEGASGTDAIALAETHQPDIILMDINMAPVNGFEATRKIVKSHPHIKIIGVSINNQPSYARNIMNLGAKGYVTKNSSLEEMTEAILQVYKGNSFICKEILDKMNEK